MHEVLDQVEGEGVPLDEAALALEADEALLRAVRWWREFPAHRERLEALRDLLGVVDRLPFDVDRSHAQTAFYEAVVVEGVAARPEAEPEEREAWGRALAEASASLRVRVPS
jgi:hypothetical protein